MVGCCSQLPTPVMRRMDRNRSCRSVSILFRQITDGVMAAGKKKSISAEMIPCVITWNTAFVPQFFYDFDDGWNRQQLPRIDEVRGKCLHIGRLLSSEQPDKQLNVRYADEIWAEKAFFRLDFIFVNRAQSLTLPLAKPVSCCTIHSRWGCIFDYSNNSAPLLAFHMPERSAVL